ncbi:PRC-barrel domain-containing protein [Neorhizobium sp. NPDC001467]|uniref:PRC-barrel domain-containing protein n=1 Tax=Neorhizobium sp. NPDC001467 TaxID=3390595 RepID=UPI003D01E681
MSKILTTMAAAALMASTAIAPAFAQTTAPAPAAPAEQTAPAAPMTNAPADPMAKPAAPMNSADSGAASGTYMTEQAATQVAASDYMGKSIYNAEDKSIGEVNDLIMEEDGRIVAAVVGVGGFLGIGEKNVALPLDKVKVMREDNDIRLTTTETAETLQSAPKFMTLSEQQTAANSGTDATSTSSTATPAAPGAAPADNATTPATPARP